MKLPSPRLQLGALLLLAGCATTPPSAPAPSAAATTGRSVKADLAEARRLTLAHDFRAANPLYEACIARDPRNADAQFLLGLSLSTEADIDPGAPSARAIRQQARRHLLAAKELGSTEPLLALLLELLRADGSAPPADTLSTNREVNTVMQAAEAAYSRGDYAQAANLHQQALTLEPGNYFAALYCGDAYFSAKDYDAAGNWFARAVAINPDIETAYRYWADALAHQRKFEEATARYIQAVVAEPYNQLTRTRFQQYAQAVGLGLRAGLLPRLRAQVRTGQKQKDVYVPSELDPHSAVLNLAYAAACATFREEEFPRQFPNEKAPRRSLPEEVSGLKALLQFSQETAGAKAGPDAPSDIAAWKSDLETLARLQRDGLLEAFALLERADRELAQDYAPYRAAHRDKLIRFIRVYWCGLE